MGGLPVSELNTLELQFLKLNNFQLNVKVEELQHYGDQLVWHWIRSHKKSIEYKKPDYEPIVHYTTDHHHNSRSNNTNNILHCSSNLLLISEKSVSEKYDSITRC